MELRDLILSNLVDDATIFTITYQQHDIEPWGDYKTTVRGHWYEDKILDFMSFEFEENDFFIISPVANTCFIMFDHDLTKLSSKECDAWVQIS